ncbi:MAG: flagellar hook-basal body complex protein FliE [bacterium]|nr:flagellar hook-basal body complex protein FliE [bacterium]
MSIGSMKSLGSINPNQAYGVGQATAKPAQNFAKQLQNAIQEVDNLQAGRDQMVDGMVTGEVTEVHDVMIAAKEAQLAFELLLEVRNKLLEGYQEIMRMQL